MLVDLLLKFLCPPGLCLVLMATALVLLFRKRAKACAVCLCSAMGLLLLCSNGWFVDWAVRSLERRHAAPTPVPKADCILVLGGGILPQEPPRQSIEVSEAGDRVLYAARLYRAAKAPVILYAGGKPPGSTRKTAESADARTLMQFLGVPDSAVLLEDNSGNTFENVRNSRKLLADKKVKRLLLVTSALHIPRALGVFRRQLPGIEIIPAPTDFSVTEHEARPFQLSTFSLQLFNNLLPSAGRLMQMDNVLHEYLGLLYYKARGWM
jgi:uncharacterized SAM-binding protein YcdF (DUF218 family)